MARAKPQRLSATFVKQIPEPGRYGDGPGGHGLALMVRETKRGGLSKCWVQTLRLEGHRVMAGLGPYPVVTLAMARERALENRRAALEGRDPRIRKGTPPRRVPTFAEAVEAVLDLHRPNWKPGGGSEQSWRRVLAPALDRMGDRPVDRIGSEDVLAVLAATWSANPSSAQSTARRLSAVLKWAQGSGWRTDNPAEAAVAALPRTRHRPKHHEAVHHAELGKVLAEAMDSGRDPAALLALKLIALTAVRSGEAREAHWSEFDLEGPRLDDSGGTDEGWRGAAGSAVGCGDGGAGRGPQSRHGRGGVPANQTELPPTDRSRNQQPGLAPRGAGLLD